MRVATASILLPLLLATCHWMASLANPEVVIGRSEHQSQHIASVNDDVTNDSPPLVPSKSNRLSELLPEGPEWEFLHIPKTGGSSVDALLRKRGHQPVRDLALSGGFDVTLLSAHCTNHGSIWHFTPEQLSRCGFRPHPYEGKQVYCVIREPVERFFSEFRWRRSNMPGTLPKDADGNFSVTAFANKTASAIRNLPRSGLRLDESNLHLQPQSWYIYDSNWGTTCHKPVLFDDVMQEMKIHRNTGDGPGKEDGKGAGSDNEDTLTRPLQIELRNILQDVYKDDFEMYDEVLSSAMRKMRKHQGNAQHGQPAITAETR